MPDEHESADVNRPHPYPFFSPPAWGWHVGWGAFIPIFLAITLALLTAAFVSWEYFKWEVRSAAERVKSSSTNR